jgi:hypothetical protein
MPKHYSVGPVLASYWLLRPAAMPFATSIDDNKLGSFFCLTLTFWEDLDVTVMPSHFAPPLGRYVTSVRGGAYAWTYKYWNGLYVQNHQISTSLHL